MTTSIDVRPRRNGEVDGTARAVQSERRSAPQKGDANTRYSQAEKRERAIELFREMDSLPARSERRERVRDELVELHLPLTEYLARRFANRNEAQEDLVQVARLGLLKSIDRFDVSHGVEFSTYATPTILGEIKRHFRDTGWAVRVPRRLQELKLWLSDAAAELSQRHGRAPTVDELATHLAITQEEVLEGLDSANAYSAISLDLPDSDDEDGSTVGDTLGTIDGAFDGVDYRESLKPLIEGLPERDKRILQARFFEDKTQTEIAAELSISQMHVSRLLSRTLQRLRAGLAAP